MLCRALSRLERVAQGRANNTSIPNALRDEMVGALKAYNAILELEAEVRKVHKAYESLEHK